jgi:uncharacterized membrane protein
MEQRMAPDDTTSTHVHAHSHGSLRLQTGSPRVARVLAIGIGLCLVATVVGLVVLRPTGPMEEAPGVIPGTVFVDGTVNSVLPDVCPPEYDATVECLTAEVRVTSGPESGELVELPVTRGIPGAPDLRDGDDIRMSYFAKGPEGFKYQFDDYQRGRPIFLLACLFVVAVVALSRMQGLRALLGMAISLVVIVAYLLPALLRGGPPLPLALVTAIVVAFCALYLAHGIHNGTHVAFAGSVLSLSLATLLGALFISLCHFTGLSDENAMSLTVAAGELDLRGLILAGLVIGSLGVLDDMTVTQVSAVSELQAADPTRSAYGLYRSGLRIGRDHVASTVNTLVLAYAGASLPLLLLFSQGGRSVWGVLTTETVAVEVVGALVGSIGLVASVPITTGLAALVVHRAREADADVDVDGAPGGDGTEDGGAARNVDDGDRGSGGAGPTSPAEDPWAVDDDADFWDRR